MSKKCYRFFGGLLNTQEKWLNKMSEKGYRLVRTGKLLYEFEKCKPDEVTYCVEFIGEKSKESSIDYANFLEDMGYKVFFKNINLNYSVGKVRWRPWAERGGRIATNTTTFNREILIVEKANDGKPFELHTSYDDAYSLGGSRAVDSTPLSKPKNTTILSSIQLDGTLRYTTFSGGTTVERFKRYLETDLLPHLNGNSILIMDNMKSHHAKAVRNLLDSSGVRCIYLPPYSPDLNPIEKLWSKVKAFLRKFKARTLDALPNAIQNAFHSVTISDCSGWFRFCGYAL